MRPHLEITEVVLVYCYIVNNDYQHNSRVLHNKFIASKLFRRLLDISQNKKKPIFKTFNSESSNIKVWLTDKNSKPLLIEDKVNINLVIN